MAKSNDDTGAVFKVALGYYSTMFIPATPEGLELINYLSSAQVYTAEHIYGNVDGKRVETYYIPKKRNDLEIEYLYQMPLVSDVKLIEDPKPSEEEVSEAA